LEHYLEKIKKGGYKLTPRRQAIIELFLNCDSHLTPDEVWGKLKKQFDQCGLPSVYRNLEILVECGILVRIQQFDRKKHYGLCKAHGDCHHHHITCVSCGKVEEISDCAIDNKRTLKGYTILSHFMQVNGICKECVK
jgi:Fur family ferric uptake transcriptional regulator